MSILHYLTKYFNTYLQDIYTFISYKSMSVKHYYSKAYNIFQRIKNTYQVSNYLVLKTNYLMSLHRPIYKINAVN